MQGRRDFIKKVGATGCLISMGLGSAISLESCSNIASVSSSYDKKRIKIKKDEIGDKEMVIVRNIALPAPILFIHKKDTSPSALLLLCTHNDCELKPTGTYLYCPCHGSEFENDGRVTKGPAIKNLKEFAVTESDTNYYLTEKL